MQLAQLMCSTGCINISYILIIKAEKVGFDAIVFVPLCVFDPDLSGTPRGIPILEPKLKTSENFRGFRTL